MWYRPISKPAAADVFHACINLVILLCLFARKSRCFHNRLGMVLKEQVLFKHPKLLRTLVFLTLRGIDVFIMKVYKKKAALYNNYNARRYWYFIVKLFHTPCLVVV